MLTILTHENSDADGIMLDDSHLHGNYECWSPDNCEDWTADSMALPYSVQTEKDENGDYICPF